ncbi:relaxin-3 receptor 1-like [Pristis pectinata]|uniref:relaxin-3 receptor 1-like n=1 Tax=Pristis pectinata TaxID=685728 RepID=UPI00223E2126|nr:relaxin-3 receptor 1-like [Pristis pectinata]
MAMPDRDCYSEDDGVSLSLNKTNQCLEDLLKSLIFHGTEVDNDGSKVIRILISIVYSVVCAMGLIGNLLVLYLLQANKKKSTMTILVMGLAVTDIQFVLTLPFWAVDTAMDFSWPFGRVMCKVVSSVTVMSMYASVFFLAVMSITRYCSVSQSLKMRRRSSTYWDRLTCIFIWGLACVATLPQATYSTTIVLPTEELCITKFPEVHSNPQFWFGVYQALKVLVGFILPLAIISASYLLLLRFVNSKEMSSNNPKRTSRVTKSVTIVVLAFFISWLPNQAITLWSAFIKLNVVHFSVAFYNTQAYIFPVTVCLAHSNSCLNPVLYCLIRREFRVAVRDLVLKVTRVRRIRASQSSGPPGKKRQLPVTISMTRCENPASGVPRRVHKSYRQSQGERDGIGVDIYCSAFITEPKVQSTGPSGNQCRKQSSQ